MRADSLRSGAAGGRPAALAVLRRVLIDGRSLTVAVAEHCRPVADPRERALARELATGVIRRLLSLRHVLRERVERPLRQRDAPLEAVLLLGLYQLLYTRIPAHAAVHETVRLAGRTGWRRGLANAVLRRVAAEREATLAAIEDTPDLEIRYAHPGWIIDRMRTDWPDDWEAILAANCARAPMTLRASRRAGGRSTCLEALQRAGCDAFPHPLAPDAIVLHHPADVDTLPGFAEGAVSVQDAAAQLAVPLLDLEPGLRVLDACAAPGGKTAQILDAEPAVAEVVAIDIDPGRLRRVAENLARTGTDGAGPGWWRRTRARPRSGGTAPPSTASSSTRPARAPASSAATRTSSCIAARPTSTRSKPASRPSSRPRGACWPPPGGWCTLPARRISAKAPARQRASPGATATRNRSGSAAGAGRAVPDARSLPGEADMGRLLPHLSHQTATVTEPAAAEGVPARPARTLREGAWRFAAPRLVPAPVALHAERRDAQPHPFRRVLHSPHRPYRRGTRGPLHPARAGLRSARARGPHGAPRRPADGADGRHIQPSRGHSGGGDLLLLGPAPAPQRRQLARRPDRAGPRRGAGAEPRFAQPQHARASQAGRAAGGTDLRPSLRASRAGSPPGRIPRTCSTMPSICSALRRSSSCRRTAPGNRGEHPHHRTRAESPGRSRAAPGAPERHLRRPRSHRRIGSAPAGGGEHRKPRPRPGGAIRPGSVSGREAGERAGERGAQCVRTLSRAHLPPRSAEDLLHAHPVPGAAGEPAERGLGRRVRRAPPYRAAPGHGGADPLGGRRRLRDPALGRRGGRDRVPGGLLQRHDLQARGGSRRGP